MLLFEAFHVFRRNRYHGGCHLVWNTVALSPQRPSLPPTVRPPVSALTPSADPPQIVASGRLAFGRFTLSRDGLLVLLWAAKLVPAFTRPPPPPSFTSEETHRVFGRTPQARPRGRAQLGAARSRSAAEGGGSPSSEGGSGGVGKTTEAFSSSSPRKISRRARPSRLPSPPPPIAQRCSASVVGPPPPPPVRVSYVLDFEVDRAAVVLVGGGGDDDPRAQRPADGESGTKAPAPAAAAAAAAGTPSGGGIRTSGSPRGSRSAASAAADLPPGSDGSDAGEAAVGAAATIIRLTVPRVGIRACSTAVALAAAPPSSREVAGASGGASVTMSAQSVEGHFEVEDPGTMVPLPPPPGPSGQEPQDSTAGKAERRDAVLPAAAAAVATPQRESHRLRWLAIRKATFVTGGSRSGGAESVVSGGRRGSSGRSGVPVPPIAAAAAASGVDGLAVEGVWAEWSPALFFLAGQSGAMVRISFFVFRREMIT